MDKQEAKMEALRYVENAREILSEKGKKQEGWYTDPKYVKMAGNTLWNGVLVALDFRFPEVKKGKGRSSQGKYREKIRDGKASHQFETGYQVCYLSMGYDGFRKETIMREAILNVKALIDWATA
jgi:hypothetical protein